MLEVFTKRQNEFSLILLFKFYRIILCPKEIAKLNFLCMHTSKYFKILCWFIILFFVQSSLGCLLEEPLNDLAGLSHTEHHAAPDSGHNDHHQEKKEPKSHDHENELSEYCCDSSLFLFARSEKLVVQHPAKLLFPSTQIQIEYNVQIYLSINTNYLIVPKSTSPRTRDNYVLSCLLHAPPII